MHRRAGFEVPETRYLDVDGGSVPVESVYSLWAEREPGRIRCNTDGSMELTADTLREFGVAQLDWFGRFVVALLTGNGDLHSENMSLMVRDGQVQLSPVYDPAPMRAYRGRDNHDLLSALPFSGIGGTTSTGYRPYADSGDSPPPDLRAKLITLGVYAGLGDGETGAEIDRLLAATAGYAETVAAHLELALPEGYQERAPDVGGFVATLDAVARACR